jgi:multidrug efflux pump subunit AcrB
LSGKRDCSGEAPGPYLENLAMWIVALALRRPYTFIVVGILIILLGIFTIVRTPKDIFPDINIPVIAVIWNYSGLPAEEMEKHIVSVTERGLSLHAFG